MCTAKGFLEPITEYNSSTQRIWGVREGLSGVAIMINTTVHTQYIWEIESSTCIRGLVVVSPVIAPHLYSRFPSRRITEFVISIARNHGPHDFQDENYVACGFQGEELISFQFPDNKSIDCVIAREN